MNARRKPSAHLTVRGVPPSLARKLDDERRRTGASMNRTVLDLLARALGLQEASGAPATNGLERLAGGWSDEDLAEFERATESFERVDDELWR
jgi:hypothetical protein